MLQRASDVAVAPEPEPEPQSQAAAAKAPVDVRNAALLVLATLAILFTLRWAAVVLIPLAFGILLSYAFAPPVDRLERWRVPRPIGAALVLTLALGSAGGLGYWLSDDAGSLIDALPSAARKVRLSVHASHGNTPGRIDMVQKAAAQLQLAAEESAALSNAVENGVMRVRVEPARFNVKDYLWAGGLGVVRALGQATVVVLIAYFLLSARYSFRRKFARMAGPTFSRRKITVQALDEITEQIQRYLLVQLVVSVAVGVATGVAFWALGLERAPVWGVAAAALNLVPYLGSIVLAAGAATLALQQFGTLEMALAVAGTALLLRAVSGYLFTPWLTSRTSRLNPVVVFVGVLAWGWLWGVWGLLLGVPILMAVKAVCDRVDDLKPVGELLGGNDRATPASAA